MATSGQHASNGRKIFAKSLAGAPKSRNIAASARLSGLVRTLVSLLECAGMRTPKESGRAAAAAVMTDQPLESRVARLESDVAHIRSDVADIKLDIRGLRTDLREVDKSLRAEMQSLRAELHGVNTSLRAELHGVDTSLRGAIAELDQKLTRGLAANRIWMLLQSAAVLGVMARGFKWL